MAFILSTLAILIAFSILPFSNPSSNPSALAFSAAFFSAKRIPYYLAHKAELLGYKPEVILSGRRVNEQMGIFVANKVIKMMIANDKEIKRANILLLGFTFKENCPDIRNTRVIDIYQELITFSVNVSVYDPWANGEEVETTYSIKLIDDPYQQQYDAVILAIQYQEFLTLDYQFFKENGAIIFDTKSFVDRDFVDARL